MSSQDPLSNMYRQPETVQLAPDALVFINGSNMLTDPNGVKFDIRQDITDINTSLSVDTVPGTASFTISYPEHQGGRFCTLASGMSRYSNLKIMSEVEFYFRGRFPKEDATGKEKHPYYKAFWGVITALTENYSDGVHTISVSCADILRWWQIANAVINPSILATQETLESHLLKMGMKSSDIALFLKGKTVTLNGRPLSITGNIFSGMTIPEVLKELSTTSLLQMAPVEDYLNYAYGTAQIKDEVRKKAISGEMMNYWVNRMNSVGTSLKIYGLEKDKLDIDPKLLITPATDKSLENITTILYQSVPTSPAIAKSDRKSQLEIANELKEVLHYEFFMDVNGEITFKMPFYNMDVRNNVASILHDVDIINWNFIQSDSEVITRVDVSGTITDTNSYDKLENGIARDSQLALQFGERMIQRSMPWLHKSEQCYFWAKSELARQNALIRQGSVTILGRPELRLGYPVFIPSRDAFYYIKGIENRFTFGGTYTTTLTLSAERTKTQNKNSIFRNVGEIKDEQITIVGDSIAEPNEVNNFVKQVSMPSICTPRAKEHISIVEPSFTVDLSDNKEKFGEWKKYNDIPIEYNTKGDFEITNYEGYEVIGQIGDAPYVTYGNGLEYSPESLIKSKTQTQDFSPVSGKKLTEKEQAKIDAQRALMMDIQNMQLVVDPNNVMYTLDSETGNMISFSGPEIAQNMLKDETGGNAK